MDFFSILAQANESASPGIAAEQIQEYWTRVTELGGLEAFMFISFGVVWLLYGWRVFKVLVVISFALLGLKLGMEVAGMVQGINNEFAGGIVGMLALSILSVPLMRWSVGLLGAFAGAIFTAGIWYAVGLDEQYIPAGALIGMVGGGMISFIVFRIAVILFTSMGGGALVLTGALALVYKYGSADEKLKYVVTNVRWVLPVALMALLLIGLVAQHKFVKSSKQWEI